MPMHKKTKRKFDIRRWYNAKLHPVHKSGDYTEIKPYTHRLAKNNVGGFYSVCASTIWTKFRMSLMA